MYFSSDFLSNYCKNRSKCIMRVWKGMKNMAMIQLRFLKVFLKLFSFLFMGSFWHKHSLILYLYKPRSLGCASQLSTYDWHCHSSIHFFVFVPLSNCKMTISFFWHFIIYVGLVKEYQPGLSNLSSYFNLFKYLNVAY